MVHSAHLERKRSEVKRVPGTGDCFHCPDHEVHHRRRQNFRRHFLGKDADYWAALRLEVAACSEASRLEDANFRGHFRYPFPGDFRFRYQIHQREDVGADCSAA